MCGGRMYMSANDDTSEGEHMNTQTDLRSILQLLGGCLFCLGLAALGFYPFSAQKRGRDHAPAVANGRVVKARLS